jgi:RCC1 and BTB domain-containing protein
MVEALWGKRPKQIACGGFHTAVVTEDGKVYTHGGGEHGQLGHGDKVNKLKPTLVQALDPMFVSQITCGWSHSVGLTADGKVWTWGNGDHGKLGLGNGRKVATPQMVEKLAPLKVVKVASYNEHTAALAEPYDDLGGNVGGDVLGVGMLSGKRATTQVSAGFLHDLRHMVNDEEFCDVTFLVEGRQVHAHRAILARRCEHFAAMFRSGMRESIEREICIPNVTHDAFRLLLEFLYTDNVKVDVEHSVEVYMAADLYQLDRLRGMSTLVVKRNLSVANVTFLLNEASDASCDVLKDLCMEYMVSNFDVISKREEIKVLSHALLLELLSKRP